MEIIIKADLYRYGGLTNFKKRKKIYGFKFMYYLRKASIHKGKSILGIYYRFRLKRLKFKYGYQIKINTSIGEGFYTGHFSPIVISPKTIIGKN